MSPAYSPDAARLAVCLGSADGDAPEPFSLCARDGRRFSCDAKRLDSTTLLLRLSGGPDAEPRTRALYESLSRLQGITGGGIDPRTLEERLASDAASRLGRLHAFTAALAQAITLAQVSEVVVDFGMAATSARSAGCGSSRRTGPRHAWREASGPRGRSPTSSRTSRSTFRVECRSSMPSGPPRRSGSSRRRDRTAIPDAPRSVFGSRGR